MIRYHEHEEFGAAYTRPRRAEGFIFGSQRSVGSRGDGEYPWGPGNLSESVQRMYFSFPVPVLAQEAKKII